MARDAEAALAKATELLFPPSDEEAPVEESGSEDVAEETETPQETGEFTFPSFDGEVPDDLAAELEEPEDAFVPDAEEDDEEEYDEEVDPAIMARLKAAEKKAAYYEGLRAKEAKKGWKEEAQKFFPLSEPFLDEIDASSRRGYLKSAKAMHTRMKPLVEERIIAPMRVELENERTRITAEARAEAEKAWGRPAVDSTPVPSAVTATHEELARNRAKGDLASTIKLMMFPKEA